MSPPGSTSWAVDFAQGNHAVDGEIATAVAMIITEPVGNGIGSEAFVIRRDGKELQGLNASDGMPQD